MSRINELIRKLCPNGVEYKKVWQITTWDKKYNSVDKYMQPKIIKYNYLLANQLNEIIVDNGDVFILETGINNTKKYTNEDLAGDNLCNGEIIAIPWGGTPNVKYYNGKFVTGDNRIAVSNDINVLNTKFLYYIFENKMNEIADFYRGSGIKHPEMKKVLNLDIPVPPIKVQEEIVRILDKFGELEAELEAELEVRKNQYEFWSEKLFDIDDCEWKTTEEVFDTITDYVANGSFKSIADNVSYKNEKDYAVLLRTVDYSNNYDENKFIYIDEHAYNFLEKSKLFGGEIIINNIGAGVGTTFLCPDLGMPMSLAPNTIMMRTPNNKFYYYWFNSKRGQESIESVTAKSAMPKFNKTGFRKLLVPVPSIEKQNKIVSILDKFDELTRNGSSGLLAEIELRRKQYKYYRDKLLSFEELI